MELRRYWNIIWKRIWVIIALFLVILLGSLALRAPARPQHQAVMRFLVGVLPEDYAGREYTYDRYYTWLASEYLADDLSEVVKYSAFAKDVSLALATGDDPFTVPPGAIQGATVAKKQHRILTLTITWPEPGELAEIANAASHILPEKGPQYFAQVGVTGAKISLIDEPVITSLAPSLRERLDFPLRLFLAVLAGLALVFLLDYLDDTVRDRRELEEMGLSVLAEIPPLPGGPWRRKRP